jgi:hypothetical protein
MVLVPNGENRITKTTKPMGMWFWMIAMVDLTVFEPLYITETRRGNIENRLAGPYHHRRRNVCQLEGAENVVRDGQLENKDNCSNSFINIPFRNRVYSD